MRLADCLRLLFSIIFLAAFTADATSIRADILEYNTVGVGTVTNTRGSIVALNVINSQGVIINDLQHLGRGDNVLRNFLLFFREGSYDDPIDVDGETLPAHRVASAWSQISLVEDVLLDSNSLVSFTLNQNEGVGGTLTLAPGFYSFFFHSELAPTGEGSGNGIRTTTIDGGTSGTLLDADGNMELLSQASKGGSAFGTSAPNTERVPTHVLINFTPIPEPTSALITGILLGAFASMRRKQP